MESLSNLLLIRGMIYRFWNTFWDHCYKGMDTQGKMDRIGCWISLFSRSCFKIDWSWICMALMGIIGTKGKDTQDMLDEIGC